MQAVYRIAAARHCADLEAPEQRFAFHLWNFAALLLSSAGICVVSLSLAIGQFYTSLFFNYFQHPILFFLNFFPVFLLQLLLYVIFGRQWIAFLVTGLLIIGASIGNYYKIILRFEPFRFEDISLISAAMGVAGTYSYTINTRIIFAVFYLIAGTLLLAFLAKGRPSLRLRLCGVLLAAAAAVPLWLFVYTDEELYDDRTYYPEVIDFNPAWDTAVFAEKGFVYPFLYSAAHSTLALEEPENYDPDAAAAVYNSYSDSDIDPSCRVNVIAFQLESFADLRTLGLDGIADDVYELYDALLEESYHGTLITDVFGGGTITTERNFLCGETRYYFSPMHDYPSFVRYFADQGYQTVGNHPFNSAMYQRRNVNYYLGFQSYRFNNDYFNDAIGTDPRYLSDDLFFPEVLKEYRQLAADGPVFSFNVTFEGHGPYESGNYGEHSDCFYAEDLPEEALEYVNNYLYSARFTMQQVSAFLDELRADETPAVILFYGDHKPNLTYYDEMHVNHVLSTNEGFLNYYGTEYIIWANDAAKAQLGSSFTGEGPTISPCFLMSLLFEQLGWEGNAYSKYLNDLRAAAPVLNGKGYYLVDGSFTQTPGSEIEEAGEMQKWIQYYRFESYS